MSIADPFEGFDDGFPLGGEPHVLTDEEVAARVVQGSLGGENVEESFSSSSHVPSWSQSPEPEVPFQVGKVEISSTLPQPPEKVALPSIQIPERPKAPRRKAKDAGKAKRVKHVYVNLAEGTLENGEPYWYQVGEDIPAHSPTDALRKAWVASGRPEEMIGGRIVLKDSLRVRTITVETVERAPTRRIVIS